MNEREQKNILPDVRRLIAIFIDTMDYKSKTAKMITEYGSAKNIALNDSDRGEVLNAMDVMEDMSYIAEDMMEYLSDIISPIGVINQRMYDRISYNDFNERYAFTIKMYTRYRNDYEFVYKVYDRLAKEGYFTPVKYYERANI